MGVNHIHPVKDRNTVWALTNKTCTVLHQVGVSFEMIVSYAYEIQNDTNILVIHH